MQPNVFFVLFLLFGVFSSDVSAETFQLRNGKTVTGDITQFANGIYHVTTKEKKRYKIRKEDVVSIDFLPIPAPIPPKAEDPKHFLTPEKTGSPFQTPESTFQKWKNAAVQGDIDAMVSCYAKSKQKEKKKELKKISKEDFAKMTEVTIETKFTPSPAVYQGDRAMMEVNWIHGLVGDSQVLQFALEKDGWKILQ